MLTLITKVVSDDSLRSRIDRSIHQGTYLFGGVLKRYTEKLSLKAYLSESIVYINFPKKDESVPEVSYSTVVRECTEEEASDNDRLSWGDDVFEAGGKVYPVGFITYNAYPYGDSWLVYSDKHKKWIDVTVLYEEDKRVRADKFVLDASVVKKYAIVKSVLRTHQKMTGKIYRFLHTLDSCYLCLKYPFLYPRNRFTGQHYNNWKIMDYATRLQKESVANIRMKIFNDDSQNIRLEKFPEISTRYLDEVPKRPKGKDTVYYCQIDGQEVVLYDPRHGDLPLVHKTAGDSEYSAGDYVYVPGRGWLRFGDYEMIGAPVDFDHDGYKMRYLNIVVDPAKYRKYKVVRWAHDNILGRIFFIPTHSEIDDMDTGWFRAFGMKMLDEIKAQLKKDGMLYKYRIMQIKEKFGCYDEDSEVLTKSGFKYFRDVNLEDEFATLNETKGELEYQKATDYISYEYNGLMYELSNRGVDIKVTPNHNLYVSKGSYFNGAKNNEKREYPFELTTPDKYFGQDKRFKKGCMWTGIEPDKYFKIPDYSYTNKATSKRGFKYDRTYTIPGPSIELIPFLRFLGFYVAEGYVARGDSGKGSYSISVAYNPADEEELVTKLITDMGFEVHCTNKENGLKRLYSAPLADWLRKNCGHLAPNKQCPDFIKSLPPQYIEIFLTYLYIGDGHKNPTSNILATTSSKLKDDVCELLLKAGYAFRVMVRNRQGAHISKNYKIVAKHTEYDINWLKLTCVEIDNSKGKQTKSFVERWSEYSGKVYCVTVPNHIIYIRRNGKGYWCGNSLRWYDSGATKELFNIIEKYSAESERTCIVCGQPADYITSGYILPLCKNHINKKDIATAEDLHASKEEAEEDIVEDSEVSEICEEKE